MRSVAIRTLQLYEKNEIGRKNNKKRKYDKIKGSSGIWYGE